jgi:hypothetical protein
MASLSLFGGGFFFAPFSQTQLFQVTTIPPGPALNNYSPWLQVSASTPRGRWLQLYATLPTAAGRYAVLLGLGAPGLEVQWQPSGLGSGGGAFGFTFVVDAGLTEPVISYSFPISLEPGLRLSVCTSRDVAAPAPFNVMICIWG